jgi:hypothetical protein
MTMSAWLKAGLIGGGILFLLDLIGQIPLVGCCTWILALVVYVVVGVMAASYMLPPRDTGKAAGQGALAAVIAAFIGGLFNLIFSVGRTLIWSSATQMGQVWSQLPPEVRYQFRELGISPDFFVGVGGASICGSICCITGLIVAAILGAIGAAIYAASKSK